MVTNAKSVKVTGRKAEQKVYRHHTMFPGGLKEIPYTRMMESRPEEVRRARRHPAALTNLISRFCTRSFDEQYQECCRRIGYEQNDLNDYSSFPNPITRTKPTC